MYDEVSFMTKGRAANSYNCDASLPLYKNHNRTKWSQLVKMKNAKIKKNAEEYVVSMHYGPGS